MSVCKKCGVETEGKFCRNCGAPLFDTKDNIDKKNREEKSYKSSADIDNDSKLGNGSYEEELHNNAGYADDGSYKETVYNNAGYADGGNYKETVYNNAGYADDENYKETVYNNAGYADGGNYKETVYNNAGYADDGSYKETVYNNAGYADDGSYREAAYKDPGYADNGTYEEEFYDNSGSIENGSYEEEFYNSACNAGSRGYRDDYDFNGEAAYQKNTYNKPDRQKNDYNTTKRIKKTRRNTGKTQINQTESSEVKKQSSGKIIFGYLMRLGSAFFMAGIIAILFQSLWTQHFALGTVTDIVNSRNYAMAFYLITSACILGYACLSFLWILTSRKVRKKNGLFGRKRKIKYDSGRGFFSFILLAILVSSSGFFLVYFPQTSQAFYGVTLALSAFLGSRSILIFLCTAGAICCLIRKINALVMGNA